MTNDDTDEDVDTVSLSHSSRESLFTKDKMCDGYDPKINNFYQNFPFQVIELYPERINFIVSNNKLHSKACADNCFMLIENHANKINKSCNNLQYDTFLQGKAF